MKDKSGFVYFVKFFEIKGAYKIGFSKNLVKRIRHLKYLYGNLELMGWIYSDNAVDLEQEMHSRFHRYSYWNLTQIILSVCRERKLSGDVLFFAKHFGILTISVEFYRFHMRNVIEVLGAFDNKYDDNFLHKLPTAI